MVFVTGDIHGDPTRFNTKIFPEQKEMNKDDYVIICGDFGIIWNYLGEDNNEKYWLKYLDNKPFTTLFCCGNHENFDRLYQYPVVDFHGGKAHKISDSVYHLMRGEIFDLQGKKFFVFGGASSHDIRDGILDSIKDEDLINEWKYDPFKLFRINHVSWWERELPSEEEMKEGIKNLAKHDNKVDYIITHSPYTSLLRQMDGGSGLYKSDILTDYLQKIKQKTDYKHWLFGHMHICKTFHWERATCIYEQIIRVL